MKKSWIICWLVGLTAMGCLYAADWQIVDTVYPTDDTSLPELLWTQAGCRLKHSRSTVDVSFRRRGQWRDTSPSIENIDRYSARRLKSQVEGETKGNIVTS